MSAVCWRGSVYLGCERATHIRDILFCCCCHDDTLLTTGTLAWHIRASWMNVTDGLLYLLITAIGPCVDFHSTQYLPANMQFSVAITALSQYLNHVSSYNHRVQING
ncbi:hypothetical protein V8C42DRAFT_313422 [Trichoderma barbatum]